MPSPYPAARVAVDAEAWRAFRQAALLQGVSVSIYLGRLVEAELKRRTERPVGELRAEQAEPDQALGALAEVRVSIDELDAIAGRLARTPVAHGGSWADVGSSLRLAPERAKTAYGAPPDAQR